MEREQLQAACSELPLFPLPGVLLIPGTTLPLHVFEPRYRQLVKDCVETGKPLALPQVVMGGPIDLMGSPAIHPYAGVGFVSGHHSLPDGRYNVFIQGLARVRLEGEIPDSGHPYRVARAILLEDEPVVGEDLARLGVMLRAIVAPMLARSGDRGTIFLTGLAEAEDARVPDAIAPLVLQQDEDRQAFLAENNPLYRARLVESRLLIAVAGGTTRTVGEA